jgi:hypothetical protein
LQLPDILPAAVLYMLLSNVKTKEAFNPRGSETKGFIWLLIGLLTIAALFSPKVREEIQNLRKKVKL